MGSEIVMGLAEMFASKEAGMCRKGGWMWCCEYQMLLRIDESGLLLRIFPPKKEDHMLFLFGNGLNDRFSEGLPSKGLV